MEATDPCILIAAAATAGGGENSGALRRLLERDGYQIVEASSPQTLLRAVQQREFAAVLLDLEDRRDAAAVQERLDLIARLSQTDPALPVVVLTAMAGAELIVQAIHRGARGIVEKPWSDDRLLGVVRTQVELGQALRHRSAPSGGTPPGGARGAEAIIARSAVMQSVLQTARRVGASDAAVLITGESGTGKSLLARALHAASNRADGPLVTVNAGGLSESLFESELFGHVRGAFTDARADRVGRFELAAGGTLFLDEIANMPAGLQAKLLRVIETGEYERVGSSRTCRADVRLLTATNADLSRQVAEGRFRRDLLYRLNTVEIGLPPLRERQEDIALLAAHFLRQHAARYRRSVAGIDPAALQLMCAYPWPGNVRELDHAIERAVLLGEGQTIGAADLRLSGGGAGETRPLEQMSLEEVETYLIRRMLTRHAGSVSAAAEALGLSRSALYRRIQKYGV